MKALQVELSKKVLEEVGMGCIARKYFLQYYNLFGLDDFLKIQYPRYANFEEIVYVINTDMEDTDVQNFVNEQIYNNLCIMDFKERITEIPEGGFVCFLEKDHTYDVWKVADMVLSLITSQNDAVICYRNYLNDKEDLIKDISSQYWKNLQDTHFMGIQLLELCVFNHVNLYGDLSTLLVSVGSFNKAAASLKDKNLKMCDHFKMVFEILLHSKIHFINRVYTYKYLRRYDHAEYVHLKAAYAKYLNKFISERRLCGSAVDFDRQETHGRNEIKPEITFFHTDSPEYWNLEPIAKVAKARGFQVKFTMDLTEKAEIGFYCSHVCYPENSKLSVILLHDMAQGHDRWPNLWFLENWDKFDIGIVPGREWADRWANCASAQYVRPRLGTYMLGYPKSDNVFLDDILAKAADVKRLFKYDFTVLYAPSWENDGKEDDFVKCLADLPVNLLVKQVPTAPTPEFQFVRDNTEEMQRMHEGKYDNLTYIGPDENILVALAAADLVVSDESSVMTEAIMYGIPSIAITDWLIPDQKPSRFAIVPTEAIMKRKIGQLREEVLSLMKDPDYYQEAKDARADFFANKGNCCNSILNLIEACINSKEISDELEAQKVIPAYEIIDMWN